MKFTLTVKDCSTNAGVSGVVIGNGSCYSDNGDGTYTFDDCDSLKASAGESSVEITAVHRKRLIRTERWLNADF